MTITQGVTPDRISGSVKHPDLVSQAGDVVWGVQNVSFCGGQKIQAVMHVWPSGGPLSQTLIWIQILYLSDNRVYAYSKQSQSIFISRLGMVIKAVRQCSPLIKVIFNCTWIY